MLKYLKFILRFIQSLIFLKTTNYFGNLPFKTEPGTIYKVINGGMYKYNEFYIHTFQYKWLLLDSDEELVKSSKDYQAYQVKIIEDLQDFKQNLDKNNKL